MNSRHLLIGLLAIALPAQAERAPATETATSTTTQIPTERVTPPRDAATIALQGEMKGAIESTLVAGKDKIAALAAQLGDATPAERLRLQDEIIAAKKTLEIDVLRLRADYARRAGLEDAAQRIEASIERLLAPPVTVAPRTSADRRRDQDGSQR